MAAPDHRIPAIPDTLPAPFRRRVQSFQWHLEGAGRSPRTVGTYLAAVIHFGAALGAAAHPGTLETLGADDIRAWLRAQAAAGLKPNTINNRGRALQAFFKWAAAEYAFPNPMIGVLLPTPQAPPLPDLVDADLRALLAVTAGRDFPARRNRAFLLLLLTAGMRRAEIARMRTTDLDLGACRVRVRIKGGALHTYVFSKKARQALDRYRDARDAHAHAASPWWWLGQAGPLTPNGCYQIVRDCAHAAAAAATDPAQAARLRAIHPHTLRAVAAVRYLDAGGNTQHLKALLGWESDAMPARYTRAAKARLAEAEYDRLDLDAGLL